MGPIKLSQALVDLPYVIDSDGNSTGEKSEATLTADALSTLENLTAKVNWYGGRYIESSNSGKYLGSVTFYEIYRFAYIHDLCDRKILAQIDRLEKETQDTNPFQDFGTFFRRLPYRIGLLFRRIFCCCWPGKTKTDMRRELEELQTSKNQTPVAKEAPLAQKAQINSAVVNGKRN